MQRKKWLSSAPVIRFGDVLRRVKSEEYARVYVHRLTHAGELRRVTKGIYTASDDIFSIASNICYPGYISFLSASYLYGFTEAIPRAITVITASRRKSVEFEGYLLEFVRMKSVWGYHKEGQGKQVRFIADLEKLMIDAFAKPAYMGNFSEIENVFSNAENVDREKMAGYLKRHGSAKISQRVGYMLEKYCGIDVSGSVPMGRNYYSLDPFGKRETGKIEKKWRLRI